MPLARRFTLRLGRQEPIPAIRSPSVRKDISLPLSLLSSTSPLSYDAPSLDEARKQMAVAAAAPSPTSTLDSPHTPFTPQSMPESPTPPSLTDASSLENSPTLEYNHLSAYFPGQLKPATSPGLGMLSFDSQPPAIPKRVPSHSKKEHERLARKRSLRSFNPTLRVTREPVSPTPSAVSPLGLSIDQVIEDADSEHLDEVAYMRERGLIKLSATDYQAEIGLALWMVPEMEDTEPVQGWI